MKSISSKKYEKLVYGPLIGRLAVDGVCQFKPPETTKYQMTKVDYDPSIGRLTIVHVHRF